MIICVAREMLRDFTLTFYVLVYLHMSVILYLSRIRVSNAHEPTSFHLPSLLPPFSHPSRPALMKLTIASSFGARSAMCA